MPIPTLSARAKLPTKYGMKIGGTFRRYFCRPNLADWCEDEREWPTLDADIFNEWFDIQLSTVITDLEHEPLAREAFQPINLN